MGEHDGRWHAELEPASCLGGLVSGFTGPAFAGIKVLQKESTVRRALSPSVPEWHL